MGRHTRSSHFKKYDKALKNPRSSQISGEMDKFVKRQQCKDDIGNRSISISYEVSPNELKEIVRDICTVDGLPLNTFEKSGIKRLIKTITEQLKKMMQQFL